MKAICTLLTIALTAVLLSACDQSAPQPDKAAMQAASGAYRTCAACHGAKGEGNAALNAPALVNLDEWYLKRQLQNFKEGIRGAHPEDIDGMVMAAQAALLPNDQAIDEIVRQVAGFPDVQPLVTLRTDIGNGKETYEMICGACHGVEGVGNETLNAPSLRGIDDWYLLRQYEKFRSGVRGAHADDTYGQQMQRMGHVLSEEEARRVTAWLATLGSDE
jgi:cytochrome c oxidase subunit 2